ncbi:hypothetical protein LTS16_015668 [Friedmanniomyces endolithicus]|nr:hypothetical protein LTS16_015668 [Friedmanniomyces endolithicus]
MNLAFNAVMWGLFTRALTLASSTVRVSIINTSANFMLTAVLGAVIFRESLPGLWWLGASLLVAGSVIIGRREEGKEIGAAGTARSEPAAVSREGFRDEPDAPLTDVSTGGEHGGERYNDSIELERKPKKSSNEQAEDDEL